MDALQNDLGQVPDLDGTVYKQADNQRVEDRDRSCLRGRANAAVNAAQNNDRGHQGPEALFQHGDQAFCPQFPPLSIQLVLVLAMDLAVDVGIDHQAQGNQYAGQETGQEQLGDGGSGGIAVHDVGNAGGNDDAQATGHGHQGGGEGQIITHAGQQRNAHGTHGCGGGGAGTGDGPVEQAGDRHCAGQTGGLVANEIREYIEQPLRDLALCHDHTGDDEQGNSQ